MNKCILWVLLFSISWSSILAYTDHNIESANFLAENNIINDNSFNPAWYNLDDNITRREMLKILMNLSWKEVVDRCLWAFKDIARDDWGCKYAEAAVKEWFIAQNTNFRPNDFVTQIEALKMIMQWKNIIRDDADDWRDWYKTKAQKLWIIDDIYLEYDKSAVRWWIFSNSARTYDNFTYTEISHWLDDFSWDLPVEIQELFDNLGSDFGL